MSHSCFFLGGQNAKKRDASKNASLNFVRRMRLELTRPCDHYPLKVACIPISPPAQGLLKKKMSGKRDSNPRPQPWQGCALPTELFPQSFASFARFLLCSTIQVNLIVFAYRKNFAESLSLICGCKVTAFF